jgi:Domain of unknown function (DUF6379)
MGFDAALLSDESLTTTPDGYALTLRLPWMRSLPWSCVEGVDVVLNGEPTDQAALAFEIAGDLVPIPRLGERFAQYWVVGRPVTLHLRTAAAQPAGQRVALDLTLRLRIPYLILGPAGPLVLPVRATRELVVRAAQLEGATK